MNAAGLVNTQRASATRARPVRGSGVGESGAPGAPGPGSAKVVIPRARQAQFAAVAIDNRQATAGNDPADPGDRDPGSRAGALDRSGQFPPLLIDMVNVGEQTGDMPAALARAAERFDRELGKKIDTLAALIQPLIVCLMAGMVGLMAYLMMTTIFQTISSINK
jgi:hypothetical protein